MKQKKLIYDTGALMEDFIRSMDEFAHNGILKEPDHEAVINLAKHYIRQCDPSCRKQLILDIQTVLTVKYHYRNTETFLSFDSDFEYRILEKIREWVKKQSVESVRMMGFAAQWTFHFSARLVRAYVEPAVTQTVLTCSLIVNPVLPVLQADIETGIRPASIETGHSANAGKEAVSTGNAYSELQDVTEYSETVIDEIGREHRAWREQSAKKALPGKLRRADIKASDIGTEKTAQENRWSLNIERRRMEPAKAKASGGNAVAVRKVRELRPQSEIHTVLTENDYRFRNCVKPFKSRASSELLRLPVRFDITPAGNVDNIVIGKSPGNRELVQRMTIQLMQLRFSKINEQLGDQTVFHTFFY